MSENRKDPFPLAQLWVRGLLAWLLSAGVLLCIASWLIAAGLIPNRALGYLSSALSFLTAAAAGFVVRKSGGTGYFRLLWSVLLLVLLLLTVGFAISRGTLAPSGVLSVATFTIAGFLAGILIPAGDRGKRCRSFRGIKRKRH